MTSIVSDVQSDKVIVGVDTHKHIHVAVAISQHGVRLGDRAVSADRGGYAQLAAWADQMGQVECFYDLQIESGGWLAVFGEGWFVRGWLVGFRGVGTDVGRCTVLDSGVLLEWFFLRWCVFGCRPGFWDSIGSG